ncbi:hypothetical protein CEXT_382611 [Caerostris extrusa]|uniref:Uncharacterized protein n=1 Tax=Caerostris extrusa TaxID=172846 RepID=A0AAV4SX84_CAEEX|nr:hypothetical protein CEXT_382611 [Caerostris extrusa]
MCAQLRGALNDHKAVKFSETFSFMWEIRIEMGKCKGLTEWQKDTIISKQAMTMKRVKFLSRLFNVSINTTCGDKTQRQNCGQKILTKMHFIACETKSLPNLAGTASVNE